MTISSLDYVVLIVYLFAFIFAGYVISKKMVKSSRDFATAGQGMGFLTVVGSTVATCMGASIIFGNFQLMYSSGLRGFLIGYFWHIGWIFLVLMSGRLRKSGATSIPQYLEMRYSPFVRKVASYAVLCMGIASTAAQFRAAGSMSEALGLYSHYWYCNWWYCHSVVHSVFRYVGCFYYQYNPIRNDCDYGGDRDSDNSNFHHGWPSTSRCCRRPKHVILWRIRHDNQYLYRLCIIQFVCMRRASCVCLKIPCC